MITFRILALILSIVGLYFVLIDTKSSKNSFKMFIMAFIISVLNLLGGDYILCSMWIIISALIYISYKVQKTNEKNEEWEQD